MKELGHSIRLAREPTLAEGVALRNAIADALSGLGAVVTPLPGRALKFHMPAPWRTGKPNPLFAVTGGQVDVSAGAGAGRRVRYSLSFTRLRAYGAVAVGLAAVVGFQWTRTALVATLLLAWLITFVVPRVIASLRFRRLVTAAAGSIVAAPVTTPARLSQ